MKPQRRTKERKAKLNGRSTRKGKVVSVFNDAWTPRHEGGWWSASLSGRFIPSPQQGSPFTDETGCLSVELLLESKPWPPTSNLVICDLTIPATREEGMVRLEMSAARNTFGAFVLLLAIINFVHFLATDLEWILFYCCVEAATCFYSLSSYLTVNTAL